MCRRLALVMACATAAAAPTSGRVQPVTTHVQYDITTTGKVFIVAIESDFHLILYRLHVKSKLFSLR